MAVNLYNKMRTQLSNPALKYTVIKKSCVVYEVARVSPLLSIRIHRVLQELNLSKGVISHIFYTIYWKLIKAHGQYLTGGISRIDYAKEARYASIE